MLHCNYVETWSQLITTYLFPEKKIRELEHLAIQIMKEEMRLSIRGLTLTWNHYRYRLRILIFEDERRLGYFDPKHFEIGIHKAATNPADILRHELAHMIAYLRFNDLTHSKAFRAICDEYGFPPEIKRATAPLLQEKTEERIVQKIKKLLALSSSNNPHEAQNATLKAQELLLKHQITHLNEETDMVMRRIFTFKRASSKIQSIAQILRTFGVHPIFNSTTLEIFGPHLSVEIAEYVAHFLYHEFEQLYKEQTHLHGLAAKNSFFRGIADGYCQKIKQTQAEHSRALYKIDYALQKALPLAYPHLRTTRSRVVNHKEGSRAGKKTGSKLNIRKGLSSKDTFFQFLLE
ncbi:MAG: DUF2786 domain-containing protein [Candidatus Algichlamydia australiensis]|nr:DUF2786 domain-containing protein [Chlamydiales bacterium]